MSTDKELESIEEIQNTEKSYEEKHPVAILLEQNPWMKMSETELKMVGMYLRNQMFEMEVDKDQLKCRYTGLCRSTGDFLDDMQSFKMNIDKNFITWNWAFPANALGKCKRDCHFERCILKLIANLMNSVNLYNQQNGTAINYIDVVNFQLPLKTQKTGVVDDKIFAKFSRTDLFFAFTLIESGLVELEMVEDTQVHFRYVDLNNCEVDDLYTNKLADYFDKKRYETGILELAEFETDRYEKEEQWYKIAAYFLYLEQQGNFYILTELWRYITIQNTKTPINNRSQFFRYKYRNKVKKMPYSEASKQKIIDLFHYIDNYFVDNTVPRIPINLLIYTADKTIVEEIVSVIGRYMWYFTYISKEKYYWRSLNDIVIDRNLTRRLYETVNKEGKPETIPTGVVIFENLASLRYTDKNNENIIMNIITEKVENMGSRVCNVIYGDKEEIEPILSKYPKLNQALFPIKLDVENLSFENVNKIVYDKLSSSEILTEEIREKLYKYIKYSYDNSEIQNMEYAKRLYNEIVFNKYKRFTLGEKNHLLLPEDIPSGAKIRDMDKILFELNSLVGLDEIKEQINKLVDLLKFHKKAKIDTSNFNLNMVFSGSPGTGKTTVARCVSEILYNLGYTRLNKLVEVSAKDLIAEYIGQTAGKTYSVLKSAFGGVLFIDEAYSIMDVDKYSMDCISTMVKTMEDHKNDLVIIFAGYEKEMERFIELNPGLRSRIMNFIHFPEYTLEELLLIFKNLCYQNNFTLTESAEAAVREVIKESSKANNFGNARFVNNLYQNILVAHAGNVRNVTKKETLMTISEEDVEPEKLILSETKVKLGFI